MLIVVASDIALADGRYNQSPYSGLAIHGYDPVAYFIESAAVPGDRGVTLDHGGATWAFASEENRERFEKDPDRYLPQYGGYCAYAASQGAIADVDPTAWQVHGGKLYLNYDHKVQRLWANRLVQHVEHADSLWPELSSGLD